MTCPNGHPADGAPCVAHSCERRGDKADVKPRQDLKSATLNRDGPSRSTPGPDAEEMETAMFLAGVEDCLPWCDACRGLGEYRQGPNREMKRCGYCSVIKRHP